MSFVPISSSQNEWNNNHIGVPSFILLGAPIFRHSGTKLGTKVPKGPTCGLKWLSGNCGSQGQTEASFWN